MSKAEWQLRRDFIRKAADQQGMLLADLARAIKTSPSQLSQWLNNRVEPSWSVVVAIADALHMPVEMMVKRVGSNMILAEERSEYFTHHQLPVVGYIGAGSEDYDPPLFTDGDTAVGEGVLGFEDFPAHDPNAFVLEVKGDSMMPRFPEGTRVVIIPSAGFRNGHVHFVRDVLGNSFLKLVRWNDPNYVLSSFNPDYDVILRRPEEIAEHPTHGLIIWRATWFKPKE